MDVFPSPSAWGDWFLTTFFLHNSPAIQTSNRSNRPTNYLSSRVFPHLKFCWTGGWWHFRRHWHLLHGVERKRRGRNRISIATITTVHGSETGETWWNWRLVSEAWGVHEILRKKPTNFAKLPKMHSTQPAVSSRKPTPDSAPSSVGERGISELLGKREVEIRQFF